jgi:replicative DNA helicase
LPDIFQFEAEFEVKLLTLLVRNVEFYLRNYSFMRFDYFTDPVNRDIYEIVDDYAKKYKNAIPKEILRNEIVKMFHARKKQDATLDEYWEYVDKLFAMDFSGEQYTEDEVLQFAQRQQMKKVLKDAGARIMNHHDLKPVLAEVTKALTIGAKLELGYDYFGEAMSRSFKGYEIPEHMVPTGYRKLDRLLGGGLMGGELGILVGPSSRGKTAGLINIAAGALSKRKNVLYVGLEDSTDSLAIRLDTRISRISKESIRKESEKVRDSVIYWSTLLKSLLIIKVFPSDSVTVHDIDQYMTHEELVRGFIPDLIIIDYLGRCKKTNPKEEHWLGTNYREGRALGVRRTLPIWSAAQATEGSLTQHRVLPKHIGEATIRIWSECDVIIGLCQSEEEKDEKVHGNSPRMRWYIGKRRNEAAGREVPMIFHVTTQLLEEDITSGPQVENPNPV